MGLLKVIKDAPGYLKATLQGPQGSGKTRTAVELAATTHKLFGSTKPIAFFDTETGSDHVADLIKERTGLEPIRVKTRAFNDLMEVVNECVEGASDILIVDSITHVWRELQDAHMANSKHTRMELYDIMQIKGLWLRWPNAFLNAPVHMIVCGREGNEWANEENEETGKRELVAVGKKMKVETEFGYEASLQISMSIRQNADMVVVNKKQKKREYTPRELINYATVLKDRSDTLNGQIFEMPTGEDFMPHLLKLNPSAHGGVDVSIKSDQTMTSDEGFGREKRERVIACEEIQAMLVAKFPTQNAADKYAKAKILQHIFKTGSWTKVETMNSRVLQNSLSDLKALLESDVALEDLLRPESQPA